MTFLTGGDIHLLKKIWSLSYGTVERCKRREPPTYFDVSPADRAACELHSGALRRFLQRQPAASQNSLAASLSELFFASPRRASVEAAC